LAFSCGSLLLLIYSIKIQKYALRINWSCCKAWLLSATNYFNLDGAFPLQTTSDQRLFLLQLENIIWRYEWKNHCIGIFSAYYLPMLWQSLCAGLSLQWLLGRHRDHQIILWGKSCPHWACECQITLLSFNDLNLLNSLVICGRYAICEHKKWIELLNWNN